MNELNELPSHPLEQVHRFFEDHKKLEKKEVIVENFPGRGDAYKIVEESIEFFAEEEVPGRRDGTKCVISIDGMKTILLMPITGIRGE